MTKTIDEMLGEIEGALSVSYEREQRFYAERSTGAVVKDTQLGKALSTLTELRERLKELKDEKQFIYKQVERGMFCKHSGSKTALSNIAHHPNAPWAEGSSWNWDVSHKEYADAFYAKFPHGKAAIKALRGE